MAMEAEPGGDAGWTPGEGLLPALDSSCSGWHSLLEKIALEDLLKYRLPGPTLRVSDS